MRRVIVILIIMMSMFVFYGCKSKVPKPTSYDFSTQQKMQAAHHWDILAQDVASQITNKLNERYIENNIALYVKDNSKVTFTDAFYDLLISHLINQGVKVTSSEKASITAHYDVQLIHHTANNRQRPWPGTYTATAATIAGGIEVARNISLEAAQSVGAYSVGILSGAAIDASYGYNVSLPNNEVLISTTLKHNDTLVLKKADIYYIDDKDFWHYVQKESAHKDNNIKSNEYTVAK